MAGMRIEVPREMFKGSFQEVNAAVVAEYRANAPLACSRAGDDDVVIASMGGAPRNPQWFGNVVAPPT